MLKVILASVCGGFLLAGCGAKESKKSDQPGLKPVYTGHTFSLVGINSTRWVGKCSVVEDRENRSRKTRISLEEHTFAVSTAYYDGLECAENLIRVTFHDRYYNARKDSVERLAGWTTVAYSVEAILLALHREVLVMQYNDSQYYGLNNWGVGELKDVSGLSFDGKSEKELAKDAVRERTFKVDGDILYFAKYENQVPVETQEYAYEKIP